MITQAQMMELMVPILKERGRLYQKYRRVWARKAEAGETITTRTSDGVETTNIAEEGDMIVRNLTQAGEEYIVSASKFQQRYQFEFKVEDGYSQYQPSGKVRAVVVDEKILQILDCGTSFQFIAPWGQPEIVHSDDYLVSPPDYREVYRIARKEFEETYESSQP